MKVSVVIPCYNSADYLAETLHSIESQTFSDFEVIIVDDYSTDATWDIAESFSHKDPRFKVIKNFRTKGVSGATNSGVLSSKGEYIIRSDSDDISVPDRFKTLVVFLNNNNSVDLCGSWIATFGRIETFWRMPTDHHSIVSCHIFGNGLLQPSLIFRREIFDKYLYDESLKSAEDLDLWVKLSSVATFANVPSFLVRYRLHEANTTKILSTETEDNAWKIIKKNLNKINVTVGPIFSKVHNRLCFDVGSLSNKKIVLALFWLSYLMLKTSASRIDEREKFSTHKNILSRFKLVLQLIRDRLR